MKYTYIHSPNDQHLICCETREKVYVRYPTKAEMASVISPFNLVKEREKEAIERYEKEN